MEPIDRLRRGPKAAPEEFTNFTPVLKVIRQQLGTSWAFYEECYNEILTAIRAKEDASAWYAQMKVLIKDDPALEISHEGVLFLLREEERSENRRNTSIPSPPSSPQVNISSMSNQSCRHQHQQQQQQQQQRIAQNMVPPMFLQGPQRTQAVPHPHQGNQGMPRTIMAPYSNLQASGRDPRSAQQTQNPTNPSTNRMSRPTATAAVTATAASHGNRFDFKKAAKPRFRDEKLFYDLNMRQDVSDFFTFSDPNNDAIYGRGNASSYNTRHIRLNEKVSRYDPAADDLVEWKKRIAEGGDGEAAAEGKDEGGKTDSIREREIEMLEERRRQLLAQMD